MELSHQEELRYNRQIVLKDIDFDGQETLKNTKMLIVGLGGLGCAAGQYLAVAGVGHLTLLDFDTVDLSNLQRQVLHDDSRLGMPKVESAKLSLQRLNTHIEVNSIHQLLDEQQLHDLVGKFDVVLDCTDNVTTRNQLDTFPARQFVWKDRFPFSLMKTTRQPIIRSAGYLVTML